MPTFFIMGAERESGREVEYCVTAPDETEARYQADLRGHLVSKLVAVPCPPFPETDKTSRIYAEMQIFSLPIALVICAACVAAALYFRTPPSVSLRTTSAPASPPLAVLPSGEVVFAGQVLWSQFEHPLWYLFDPRTGKAKSISDDDGKVICAVGLR